VKNNGCPGIRSRIQPGQTLSTESRLHTCKYRETLTNMANKKRNLYPKCLKLLNWFPVLVILGARQVGKTTLAKMLGKDWTYVDLEQPSDWDRINYDPGHFFDEYPESVILDEAQEYPDIFKILRGVIDSNRKKNGRFIVTGSSSPALLNKVSETLAGRVAIVELGTFKCNENYDLPLSPFYSLFESKLSKELPVHGESPISREQVQRAWFFGGYPDPVLGNDTERHAVWMNNYQDTYINRDVAKLFPNLNRQAYRRFLTMLCKLSGTIINKSQVGRAVEASESSIRDYLEIADGTYIWRIISSFEASVAKSITKMPKGYIRDSGLLHYLLGINNLEALKTDPVVGASFEGFVCEELSKGLEASNVTNWNIHYFRTRSGAEVDLIVEGPFGVLPIEVKYGSTIKRSSLKSLIAFVKDNKLPLGMVINQSEKIEWITQEIVQVPVGWL